MAKEPTLRPAGRLVWILGAIVMVVATIALRNAVAWYGHPIAGVLVDVGGSVSSLGLPDWQGRREGLHFPQVIVPADKVTPQGSRARTQTWDDAIVNAGSRQIMARVEDETGSRTVALRVHPIEPLAWWVYAGSSLIAGLLYAGSGLIALWASPRGKLARTFAIFGVNTGLFLLSLFDIHTQRSLTPIFFVSFAVLPVSLVLLAARLPDDVDLLRRLPWLQPAAISVAVALGTVAFVIYEAGGDTRSIQSFLTTELGVGFLVFVVTFATRYIRSQGQRKETLRVLFLAMVPPYAALGFGAFLMTSGSFSGLKAFVDVLSYPAMLFAPLASAYAFVKHDLWGSRALLSRIGTQVILGGIASLAAIAAGAALASSIGLSFQDAIAGASISTLLAIVLTFLARRISDSTLFHSRAEYKPTIEQLSTELLTINSPAEVARAIERTVCRWLPCDFVRLKLEDNRTAEDQQRAISAEHELPVAFGGRPLGRLYVGAKRGGALFTNDDVDLLRTITNQGALAIAHAQAYQELEQRRQQQAQAWRGEREALVETVAAEIAHEIRYPINYFRSVFERSAQGEHLDADDVDVGREEVDRLERLVSGLKRMAINRLERSPVSVMDLAERAEALLRDALGERRVVRSVDPAAVVRCDSDKVLQVLVNLLSNGLDASGENGQVGVTWSEHSVGAELVVWDNGSGFVGDPARLFAPWFTTKPRGTGLGLAIGHRLVRAHGWNITAQRRGDRTAFVITVRREDIVKPGKLTADGEIAETEVA